MAAGRRIIVASSTIRMNAETVRAIEDGALPKGDPRVTASVAVTLGARRTREFIPWHPALAPAPGNGSLEVAFELGENEVRVLCLADPERASELAMEAITAVSLASLAIYDVCKSLDKTMVIGPVSLAPNMPTPRAPAPDGAPQSPPSPPFSPRHRPRTGVLVLSDTVAARQAVDRSGTILRDAFLAAGCPVERFEIIPDDPRRLVDTVRAWIKDDLELILTSGGTGIGPRDITVQTLEPLFALRLPGIEQALHARGREQLSTAMLSRLAAGLIGRTIVISLPGSPGAARDAVTVLIPAIFHAYAMLEGARHP